MKKKQEELIKILKRRWPQLATGVVVLAALGWSAWFFTVPNAPPVVVEASEIQVRHPLTGIYGPELEQKPNVFAVMVENAADAWPLSGIEQAFLVIEAPVEAGIPRLVAFFGSDQVVEKIGPVRSARPYFVQWARPWQALYAHVGGSPEALELLADTYGFDLNEFWNGNFFWRASDRSAPHNTYTSTELLNAALLDRQAKGRAPEPAYASWTFKDDQPTVDADLVNTSFTYGEGAYLTRWVYQPDTNAYWRSTTRAASWMFNGEHLTVNNVIVLETDVSIVDDIGRRHIRTEGEGRATVYQDGRVREAVWRKETPASPLRFFWDDGSEVALNAGKTWVVVSE